MSEYERTTCSVRTPLGWITVDAFVHPDHPGLALTMLRDYCWTVTHCTSGCSISPKYRLRRDAEALLPKITPLWRWDGRLPKKDSNKWNSLHRDLHAIWQEHPATHT